MPKVAQSVSHFFFTKVFVQKKLQIFVDSRHGGICFMLTRITYLQTKISSNLLVRTKRGHKELTSKTFKMFRLSKVKVAPNKNNKISYLLMLRSLKVVIL